jgi:AcrR family transcriptional regulator
VNTSRRPPPKVGVGDLTKAKIVAATIDCLSSEGFAGTTARAIGRAGDFNQALIFYHFGSIDELVLASVEKLGQDRLAAYRDRVAGCTGLVELVRVAKDLLTEDLDDGYMRVLSQVLAGAHTRPELGKPLFEIFKPWFAVVEQSVKQAITGTPYEQFVPTADIAYALSSLFMGIELLSPLDPDKQQAERIFRTFDLMAMLLEGFLANGLNGVGAFVTGADAHQAADIGDPDLAVADLSRSG